MDEINTKITDLRKKFPAEDDQSLLNDWERSAKQAIITANLQENDAIKLIIAQYQSELVSVNDILQNEEALFKDESGRLLGQLLHTRKKWCKKFLMIFEVARATVTNISNSVNNASTDETP